MDKDEWDHCEPDTMMLGGIEQRGASAGNTHARSFKKDVFFKISQQI